MNLLFLVPPERRPYELSYFCNFSPDEIIVAVDKDTYTNYQDWFSEFSNIRVAFLRKRRSPFSLLFHSTASDFCYDENELIYLIKNESIDVIVTVELFSFLSKQASSACKRFSLSHVVIVWENIANHPFYHFPPFVHNCNFVRRNLSKIVAVTNKSARSLIALGILSEKIKVIYPGVFVDKFKPRTTEREFSILFVGGLEKHKGFHLLLEAFEELCKRYDNLTLGVAGDGKLKGKLLKMRKEGKRVSYLGNVPHSEINLVYPKAEIFCFPSLRQKILNLFLIREEQFGFSIVEAMSAGLTVVTTNVGAIPEIVGEDNFVVKPNVNHLVDALDAVLNNPQLLMKSAERNIKRANEFFNTKNQSSIFLTELDSLLRNA